MERYVADFQQIDKTSLSIVGGKGANLGEMTRAGFPVPPGFCVTTSAYRTFIEQSADMEAFFQQLEPILADQLDEIAIWGQRIRDHLVTLVIPAAIQSAIIESWQRSGEQHAYAVRSSATAEDLPNASFAGQQDTYLNVKGIEPLMQAIRRCWASLFTDRAISYRARNGFNHRSVLLSVVVQQMVFPEVSGILFTADPISGHRGTVSIDASFGLGEALVSGLVSADLYQVRSGVIISRQIARKKLAIYAVPEGGTITQDLSEEQQLQPALADSQITELATLGGRIKKHYGTDQDIEWCYADGRLYIVQSRPITSLYPLPHVKLAEAESPHLLISFGHQQMMTDAMQPLALSVWQTMFPFGKRTVRSESSFTYKAGGRMFIDITYLLSMKPARGIVPQILSHVDEMMGKGLAEYIQRESFVLGLSTPSGNKWRVLRFVLPIAGKLLVNLLFSNPTLTLQKVNAVFDASLARGKQQLSDISGPERIRVVQEQAGGLLRTLFQQLMAYPMSGVISSRLILSLSRRWLGDSNLLHVLNKSLPGNVTSEMGLRLGDLADIARLYPQVAELLHSENAPRFRESLHEAEGGFQFMQAWDQFIGLYGMRCPGEIDITRPRWGEDSSTLLPSIASHMRTLETGEHRERFALGKKEAEEAVSELLDRLSKKPFGWFKRMVMKRLVNVFRNFMGTRETPKYLMMQHLAMYRKAIREEAQSLVDKGILLQQDDVYYVTLDELVLLVEGKPMNHLKAAIEERKREYERYRTLSPPRLMTSEGELITGSRDQRDAPEHALLGTPVSSGVVEGFARVVLRPEEAKLNKGEILIAPFTDPGWTPLFHSCIGLVMEVGGLMTHGAVVAREYGLPAVVGIDGATKRIKDGDYIRLDGTRGYVLVLEQPPK
jgi:phosphoenolpyruvate synthase/pyruvate phosphate dikinase